MTRALLGGEVRNRFSRSAALLCLFLMAFSYNLLVSHGSFSQIRGFHERSIAFKENDESLGTEKANGWSGRQAAIDCWSRGFWAKEDVNRPSSQKYAYIDVLPEQQDPWYWQPLSCPILFRNFVRQDFCEVLGGRHLVLLGDSMSSQMIYAIQYHAAAGLTGSLKGLASSGARKYMIVDARICDDSPHPTGVSLLKNWQLTEHDIPGWEPGMTTFFSALRNVTNASLVVIVNQGAHYIEDIKFLAGVRRVLKYVLEQPGVSSIIWRDTPPGHVNCTSYSGPIDRSQPENALPYHWGDFRRQNGLVRRVIEDDFPGIWHMDAYSPTVLRPDLHAGANDCLHYKHGQPSPVFHWVRLLYNMLRVMYTPQPVGLQK